MRISTSMIYGQGSANILSAQQTQNQLQQQVSSGLRVSKPSDDPVAASAVLSLKQAQALNNQYSANAATAQAQLGAEDNALSDLTTVLQHIRTQAVAAGNGALSSTDRASIAADMLQSKQQLLGIANRSDGNGQYLFSGYQGDTPPYSQDPATGNVSAYQGDSGQRLIQIGTASTVTVNDPGSAVFDQVFSSIDSFISNLQGNASDYQGDMGNIDTALNGVLTTRASVGGRMQQVTASTGIAQNLNLQYTQSISGLQDLDYAQAISDLNKQQVILQAAEQSFVKVTSLSLFSIL